MVVVSFFSVQSLLHTMLNIKLNWVKKFYKKMVVVCQKMQSNKNYYGQKKREFFKMASVMKETNRENSQMNVWICVLVYRYSAIRQLCRHICIHNVEYSVSVPWFLCAYILRQMRVCMYVEIEPLLSIICAYKQIFDAYVMTLL